MTAKKPEKSSHYAKSTAEIVSDEIARRVNAEHIVDAEINSLTIRLAENPDFQRDPESTANEYVSNLAKRRAELIAGRTIKPRTYDDHVDTLLNLRVTSIGQILFPWSVLNLTYFTEGINESPAGESEEIDTLGLSVGGLAYRAWELSDTPDSTHEKWWIHNWKCSAVFPDAPFDGRLYYRFAVDTETHIYRQSLLSGSLRHFVTIGQTSDSVQPPGDWDTIGWPVNVALPTQEEAHFYGTVPVSGSIDVKVEKNAALGFIYGTIISVAGGSFSVLWGNYGTRQTLPDEIRPSAEHYGKVEYRFEPQWWLDAVQRYAEEVLEARR